jgi:hypothetical protein
VMRLKVKSVDTSYRAPQTLKGPKRLWSSALIAEYKVFVQCKKMGRQRL